MEKQKIENLVSARQNNCIICSKLLTEKIKLDEYPITEMYEDYEKDFSDWGYLDQSLMHCANCNHYSLSKVLDVDYIYKNYLTTSSSSYGAIRCLENFSKFIKKEIIPDISNLTFIDVGGNDSYLLEKINCRRKINIDINASGKKEIELIKTKVEDVDYKSFKNSKKVYLSSHTLEHCQNPNIVLEKISDSMNDDDQLFVQVPSIELLINQLKFEQICHQHLHYFSLDSLKLLLDSKNLDLLNYEYDEDHFGTIRVSCKKKGNNSILKKKNIQSSVCEEKFNIFKKYMRSINEIVSDGMVGFGAGLMVPTLKYYVPNLQKLEVIYDENESKNNKRYLNMNVRITSENSFLRDHDVIVTSITTKYSARKILEKLLNLEAKNIIFPTMYI